MIVVPNMAYSTRHITVWRAQTGQYKWKLPISKQGRFCDVYMGLLAGNTTRHIIYLNEY